MQRSIWLPAAFLLAAVASGAPAAVAQVGPVRVNETETTVPGYYYVLRPGDPTVTVSAVGNVSATGQYTLTAGTSLRELLVYTGGVAPDRRGSATVRVYRGGQRAM